MKYLVLDQVSKSIGTPAGALSRLLGRSAVAPKKILDAISFSAEKGECIGLLGPNGAGKTSMMRAICGLMTPTTGTISVLGHNAADRKAAMLANIGFMSAQRPLLWPEYRVIDSLRLLRTLYRLEPVAFDRRVECLAGSLGINDCLFQTQASLSFGQRIKAELLGALLHDPSLIILDEPTTGLDLASQRALRRDIASLMTESGKCVLLSSHSISDVSELCGRYLFLDKGRLVLDISREQLLSVYAARRRVEIETELDMNHADELTLSIREVALDRSEIRRSSSNGTISLSLMGTIEAISRVVDILQAKRTAVGTRWSDISVHDAVDLLCTAEGMI